MRVGRQMPNTTDQLLYQTDKSSHRGCSIKKAVLKNFALFTGKHPCWSFFSTLLKRDSNTVCYCCEIFKNTYFEEHLRTTASELTLENECLKLCFWTVAFKTILTRSYYKITSHFQAKGAYIFFIFNSYASFWAYNNSQNI